MNGLIKARKARGLSQEELAERLGCHQSLIARMESGERRIDVIELVVVCRAIGASAEELVRTAEAETDTHHRIV